MRSILSVLFLKCKRNVEFIRFFSLLNVALLIFAITLTLFCEQNHFVFGGATGISLILSTLFPELDISLFMWLLNLLFVIVGCVFLGMQTMGWTIYSSFALSYFVSISKKYIVLNTPITADPLLELCFAIILPAIASGIVFYIGTSTGGTEILALILKKYTGMEIGRSVLICDFGIVLASIAVYGPTTGLYSLLGFAIRCTMIDTAIESLNLRKICTIITEHPESIRAFILENLHRTATEQNARGAYSHEDKSVIMVALTRYQAIRLREFLREADPEAFLTIVNSSEIIGKGFQAI